MPNLLHTQNQYFKFEKDNKNNVIKKTNSQGMRRAATSVATANSKTKNSLPVSLSNSAADGMLKRNVYQPPIRNVQRDYSAAAPRVQTRLTPMTTLAVAAGKPPLSTTAGNVAISKRSRAHSPKKAPPDVANRNSSSPHRPPPKKSPERTLSPNCKQRLARLQKATMQRKNSSNENTFSAFAAYENKDVTNTARSMTQTPRRVKQRYTSTTSNKSRSQSSSPHRPLNERLRERMSFRQPPPPAPSNKTSFDSLEKQQSFTLKSATRRLERKLKTPPPTPDSIFDSNLMVHSMEKILSQSNVKLTAEELELLQRVVGADQRAPCLRTSDTMLFKDILRTQLQQIEAQEVVVKRSLIKLENTQSSDFMNVMRQMGITDESLNPEDALIPALPLLEKEVRILQTLGERLEAKLSLHEKQQQVEMKSASTSVTNLRPIMKPILEYAVHKPERKWHGRLASVYGVRCEYGYAQEFKVVKRSLLELKEHAGDAFYIPAEADLKCITFAELQQHPEMILQYLKPKHDQGLQFNLLDHDPKFFKTFFETSELQEKCKMKWQEAHKVVGFPVEDMQQKLLLGSPRRVVKEVEAGTPLSHREVGGKCEVQPSEEDHREVACEANMRHGEMNLSSEGQLTEENQNEERTKNLVETLIALAAAEANAKAEEVKLVATPKKKVKARKKSKQKGVNIVTPTKKDKKSTQPENPTTKDSRKVPMKTSANHPMMKTILVGFLQTILCLLLIVAFTYPEISCTSL